MLKICKYTVNFCRTAWRIDNRKFSGAAILGIETSCDDCGAAVVTTQKKLLGDALSSQNSTTIKLGGVLPTIAAQLHSENIENVVSQAVTKAGLSLRNLSAIAVTVKPGMAFCLKVGVNYAKRLSKEYDLPIIPVHHMEAHALTAALTDDNFVFPFLVLLLSGGHCLLAVAREIDDFLLLGTSLDISPGECLDKIARRLRLSWLDGGKYRDCSGGMAIELLAQLHDRDRDGLGFTLPLPRSNSHDCDFSFSGIQVATDRIIERLEKDLSTDSSRLNSATAIPVSEVARLCYSVQVTVSKLICRRVQRAIEFCAREKLLPMSANSSSSSEYSRPALVVSGGVASNSFIRNELSSVTENYGMRLVVPPASLCTDNGVMIAWNGALLYNAGLRILHDSDQVDFTPQAPFGFDIRALVRSADIKIKPVRSPRSKILQS